MKLAGKEDWLIKAGEVVQERAETAEEASHRPIFSILAAGGVVLMKPGEFIQ